MWSAENKVCLLMNKDRCKTVSLEQKKVLQRTYRASRKRKLRDEPEPAQEEIIESPHVKLVSEILSYYNTCEKLPDLRKYCESHKCSENIWQYFGSGSNLSARNKFGVSLECYIKKQLSVKTPRDLWIISSYNPENNYLILAFAEDAFDVFPNEREQTGLHYNYGRPLFMKYVQELTGFTLKKIDEFPETLYAGERTPECEQFLVFLRNFKLYNQIPTVSDFVGKRNPNSLFGMWNREDLKPDDFPNIIPHLTWLGKQDILNEFGNENWQITIFNWKWIL